MRFALRFVLLVFFAISLSQSTKVDFGHSMLEHFYMRPGHVNLNHGSYGSVCKMAKEAEDRFYMEMESDSNLWFRNTSRSLIRRTVEEVARYVGSPPTDLVLVESSSWGINSILRAFPFQRGDKVLYMNIAYPMVTNILQYLEKTIGIVPVVINIPFPVSSPADFLGPVAEALRVHGSEVKLASIDHISSQPTCVLPIKELVDLCHTYSVPVLVDGAHSMSNVPLNLTDMKPDFFVSSAHKWLYSPKGSGFLYVAPQFQNLTFPAIIASENKPDSYQSNYEYTGTRNYNSLFAMTAALQFRQTIGDLSGMEYCTELAWNAANMLRELWNTELLAPKSMNSAIVNVRLPCTLEAARRLTPQMLALHDTYVQTTEFQGLPWIRVSGQIYLELSDFELAGRRILELCHQSETVDAPVDIVVQM